MTEIEIPTSFKLIYFILEIWIDFLGMKFEYGFEYLGPTEILINNPSTDRYIISSLLALKEYNAACLYGDVGSGRTKTVMEVGKVNFNFSILKYNFGCRKGFGKIYRYGARRLLVLHFTIIFNL